MIVPAALLLASSLRLSRLLRGGTLVLQNMDEHFATAFIFFQQHKKTAA